MNKLVAIAALAVLTAPLPVVAQVAPAIDGTQTTIDQAGNTFTITGGTQAGRNLFHSFQQFGLNAGQIANFLANPAIQNILGRVTGGEASVIHGKIQVTGSNANLYLMNPAGIVFGTNASLDVPGSFTATTANGIGMGNHWFNATGPNHYAALAGMPNQFAFTTSQPGAIVNAGNLTVGQGQSVTLLGGTVINTGTIAAPGGTVTIAAVPGEKLVRITPEGSLLSLVLPTEARSEVNPTTATPLSLPALLTGGNLSRATGLTVENGVTRLTGAGVAIPTEPGVAIASHQINVSGSTGGTVQVLGQKVGVVSAAIDASGTNGGGTVLIGGDYKGQGTVPNAQQTYVSRDSVINADALQAGNGGRAIVWADGMTQFYGTATARGGSESGNGGFVEVSGKQDLVFRGNVDTTATNGTTGTLLLDPASITILPGVGDGNDSDAQTNSFGNGSANGVVFVFDSLPSVIYESELEGLSARTFIYIGAGDITIQPLSNGRLTFQPGSGSINFAASNTFSMSPGDTIETQGATLAISGNTLQVGNLATAGGDIILNGNVVLRGNTSFNSAGGTTTIGQTTANTLSGDAAGRNLIVDAGTGNVVVNSSTGISNRPNNLTLRGNQVTLAPSGLIGTTGELRIESQADLSFTNTSANLLSDGNLVLQSGGRVALTNVNNSDLSAGVDLSIIGQNINVVSSVLRAGRDLRLQATETITANTNQLIANSRDITIQAQTVSLVGFNSSNAARNINVTATGTDNTRVDRLIAGQDLNLTTSGSLTLDGPLQATRDLTVQARAVELGSLDAGRNLQLQTQENLELNGSPLRAGGNAEVRSLTGSITVTNATLTQPSLQGDLSLIANTDLTIQESQLQVPGAVRLQAGGNVIVRDGSNPAITQSGGDLTIRGNAGINLEGFRNPNSRVQSGGNLTLISDGAIAVNTPIINGGSFSAQRVGGGAANLQQTVTSFNTLISSIGDVSFGNYEGPALKIETLGSITGGNISIFGGNPSLTGTDPDIALLTTQPALILRAGVPFLQNPVNLPPDRIAGNTTVSAIATVSAPGSVTVGNINTAAGNGDGPVIISASGNVSTGTIRTGGSFSSPVVNANPVTIMAGGHVQTGDITSGSSDVRVTATGNIQTNNIDTFGFGNTSSVRLTAGGNVQVSTIATGAGGIDITAGGSFRAIGSFISGFSGGGIVNDPDLINYLVGQGFNREQLLSAGVRIPGTPLRLSLISRPSAVPAGQLKSPVVIRYGDQQVSIIDRTYTIDGTASRATILGDSQQSFRMGPVFDDNLQFVPLSSSNRLADYNPITNNFAFTFNTSRALVFGTSEFPAETSGLAAGFATGAGSDSSLYGAFQNRTFTPIARPIVPGPGEPTGTISKSVPSSQETATATQSQLFIGTRQDVQRAVDGQAQVCNPASPIASATPTETRSSSVSNPCITATDDQQILKVLGVDGQPQPR